MSSPGYWVQKRRSTPSQLAWQTAVPVQAGRWPCWCDPAGSGLHRPTAPARLQASHWPVQALSQQIPSAHVSDAHWVARVQAAPLGRRWAS
ncbi:MAG: hypothetical protein ACRD2Z_15870, partial [Thermoanaerobaculia bacterium]